MKHWKNPAAVTLQSHGRSETMGGAGNRKGERGGGVDQNLKITKNSIKYYIDKEDGE